MLEDDLIFEVFGALNSGNIAGGWNETTIVLIPKKWWPGEGNRVSPHYLMQCILQKH